MKAFLNQRFAKDAPQTDPSIFIANARGRNVYGPALSMVITISISGLNDNDIPT